MKHAVVSFHQLIQEKPEGQGKYCTVVDGVSKGPASKHSCCPVFRQKAPRDYTPSFCDVHPRHQVQFQWTQWCKLGRSQIYRKQIKHWPGNIWAEFGSNWRYPWVDQTLPKPPCHNPNTWLATTRHQGEWYDLHRTLCWPIGRIAAPLIGWRMNEICITIKHANTLLSKPYLYGIQT